MDLVLTPEEQGYYARQIAIPQFGMAGQLALKSASVLVVGAGGLGCPILLYLAAAGVGRIGIADYDRVSLSNLHRQIIYGIGDCGQSKVATAAAALRLRNPLVEVIEHDAAVNSEEVTQLVSTYDVVVDATDNFSTKFLLNDACWFAGKPMVYGSIHRFEGQLAVFNLKSVHGDGCSPNYRDLYPAPPPAALAPDCSTAGVLGVLPGLVGCLQANEVIKIVTGVGEVLAGRLLIVDALSGSTRLMRLRHQPGNPLSGVNRQIHQVKSITEEVSLDGPVRSISANELIEWQAQSRSMVLVDVRNADERAVFSLGGVHWPLSATDSELPDIGDAELIVTYCQSGIRSRHAAAKLIRKGYAVERVLSLDGGVSSFLGAGYRKEMLPDPTGGTK
ncbi:molybdopterin-synthase adenylyltransferase MoeB [Burkholderia sp. Ac-20344]|uniref:molybdopterin-synthase adenylyltransferase MoeB n=1 Tax=Burkholderia sp. Ac-20344 TaxID=2703890 RepID=UPI00197C3D07|nr:molybdopterin-synthase adenylyltransferase MoeB [Burkholderia sp. Ac-20344]MBN3831909.1 molybdopterin-synthase adenylyltransferase MoeB [Burkholderia sp. Ac-20344]